MFWYGVPSAGCDTLMPKLSPRSPYASLCFHFQVALRMKSEGKSVRALDTIPYIICKDGSENAAR